MRALALRLLVPVALVGVLTGATAATPAPKPAPATAQKVLEAQSLTARPVPAPRHRPTMPRAARDVPPPRRVAYAPPTRSIRVVASVPISAGQAAVNQCAGPVEIRYPGVTPQIVQHDYCGGTWVLGLGEGERIHFTGAVNDTYVVNGNRRQISDGSPVTAVNGLGDLVAQTCIPGTSSIQLVGLTRIA